MTFLSLKSRRITASNGATANKFRRALTAFALCGAVANALVSNIWAAEPAATLKWKSRNIATPKAAVVVEPSRPEPRSLELRKSSDIQLVAHEGVPTQNVAPLDDPFGDKPKLPPAAPKILPPAPTQPAPTPSLPDFGTTPLPGVTPGMQSAQGTGSYLNEPCPKPGDLKSISQLTNVIAASAGDLPQECTIDDRIEASVNRPWEHLTYTWKASGLCHKPLYFEEQNLERYGHSTGPFTQPIVSAAHFFCTFPVLPYKMGIRAPNECEYALGYYRPGSCAPYVIPGVPITARAIAYEVGTAVGLSYILP